jgi:hypothetical protein
MLSHGRKVKQMIDGKYHGILTEREGRLSTVDLLNKEACFVKMQLMFPLSNKAHPAS